MGEVAVRLPGGRPRRAAFSLTPLADVMFQLLIFFMLSTSLAPYAMLPLGGGAPPEEAEAPEARAPGTPPPAIWQLGRGTLRIGGRVVALEELGDAARAARQEGVPEIVLLTSSAATVQDMASALETLRAAEIPRVRLIGRGGP